MLEYSGSKRAVALKYDKDKDNAPIVIASGSGFVADKLVDIAETNGVPVYKDDSLSVMLSQLDIGSEIPESLFKSVVDIYAYFLNYGKDEIVGTGELENTEENWIKIYYFYLLAKHLRLKIRYIRWSINMFNYECSLLKLI